MGGRTAGKIVAHIGFTPELEHKIIAGADILVHSPTPPKPSPSPFPFPSPSLSLSLGWWRWRWANSLERSHLTSLSLTLDLRSAGLLTHTCWGSDVLSSDVLPDVLSSHVASHVLAHVASIVLNVHVA